MLKIERNDITLDGKKIARIFDCDVATKQKLKQLLEYSESYDMLKEVYYLLNSHEQKSVHPLSVSLQNIKNKIKLFLLRH